tara:strand:+ start:5335 stop:5487 length:153 start_codon:yes stop_codon:yes gene_type:complete
MEASNLEIFALLTAILAFGSSLIHYSAFAKSRAKVAIKSELKEELYARVD